ncbi:hypothetical protein V2J09_008578 [Rumex salicifolius]
MLQYANSEPQVPCYFVLGDSLSDNGNNNDLQRTAKVNYLPYGIDYPGKKATRRFSNGLNIVDVISKHLGFEEASPPFAIASKKPGQELLKGVNYASGSACIRLETGQHLVVITRNGVEKLQGARMSVDQQLMNHRRVILKIAATMGGHTSTHLNKCLYTINVGSNDYLNNYFLPEKIYSMSKSYTLEQYAWVLVDQYSLQIKKLYEMGARKVALLHSTSNKQIRGLVIATALFNNRLQSLVDELNEKLNGAKFTVINQDEIFISSCPGLTDAEL